MARQDRALLEEKAELEKSLEYSKIEADRLTEVIESLEADKKRAAKRIAELEVENDQLQLQLGQAAKQCNDALAEVEEAREKAKKARMNAYIDVCTKIFEEIAKHKGADWDIEAEFKKLESYRQLLEGKPPVVDIESGGEETEDEMMEIEEVKEEKEKDEDPKEG